MIMTPNLYLVQQRCAEIQVLLRQLHEIKEMPVESFTSDNLLVDATLYRLMRGVEAAQAICTHLAARIPTRTPSSAPDCFVALSESGVIPIELANKLQQMARFRNLLVHRYWELDLAQVHSIIYHDIEDLADYVKSVENYLR